MMSQAQSPALQFRGVAEFLGDTCGPEGTRFFSKCMAWLALSPLYFLPGCLPETKA